jgi:hypothetical protein
MDNIIMPLKRTLARIESQTRAASKGKENNLIITIAGTLCRVLASQKMKFGNL